jgi:hypothetical protein
MEVRPPRGSRSRARVAARWREPGVVLATLLLVQVVVLAFMVRRVWFFGDDWDFLLTRGTIPGEGKGWFLAHNGHWSTGLVLIYRVLFSVAGLHHGPYAAVQIALHVSVCWLVYRLLGRVGVPAWTAVALTSLVVFCGVGSELLFWGTTMLFLGALVCGLAAVLVLLRTGATLVGLLGVWALLVTGLMFAGGGISSVCLAAVFAAFHAGFRRGLLVVSVPAGVYLFWYAVIGHVDPPPGPSSGWELTAAPSQAWTGLAKCLELASGVPSGGAPILLLLVGGAFLLPGPEALRHLAWAGVVAAVVNNLLVAGVRLAAAEESRYYYVAVVLLLPALALWVMWIPARLRVAAPTQWILAAAVLLALLVNGLHLQHAEYRKFESLTADQPALVVGIQSSLDANEKMLTPSTGLWFDGDFRANLMSRPEIRAAMPSRRPTVAGRLDAERWFFVDVDEDGHDLPAPPTLTYDEGYPRPGTVPSDGCRIQEDTALRTVLEFPTGDGAEIDLTSRATTVMTRLSRGKTSSKWRTWPVERGTVHVSTTARDADLEVALERAGGNGDVLVCADRG